MHLEMIVTKIYSPLEKILRNVNESRCLTISVSTIILDYATTQQSFHKNPYDWNRIQGNMLISNNTV